MTASPSPTLYHVPRTISSPIVQCLLELDVVNKPVQVQELSFADLKTAAHLAINPMGTSPAYQDGSTVLWESGAVLDYLLEEYDQDGKLWIRPGHPNRAKYLHLKQYIIATVYPFLASLFIHTLKPVQEQDADYMESAKHKWVTLLGPILTEWCEGPYMLGETFTAVDFLITKPLNNAHSMGLLENDFPTLYQLLQKIRQRPSFVMAYENLTETKAVSEDRSILLVPSKKRGA